MNTSSRFPPFPFAGLRGICRPAHIALFLYLLAGLADGTLMPFFALWAKHDAGIATACIGLLLGCYAGGELLATPLVGGIADRVGRRPVLLASTAGIGVGFLLLYAAHGVVWAAGSLIFIGCFESVLHPTLATVIADTVSPDALRRHFASARVMSNLGGVVGPIFGALLALHSLGSVFLGCASSLLLGALVVAVFLPETWQKEWGRSAEEDDDEGLAGVLPAFRDKQLAALLLGFACLEIAGSWIESVLPLYAHNGGVLTPSGVGLLFAYGAALIVVLQRVVTKLSARLSAFWLVLGSALTLVAAFVILLLHPFLLSLIAAVTLFSFAQMLFGPLIPTTVNELAPPAARSTYMAAASVMNDLRDTLGPTTGTLLYAASAKLPWMLGMPIALSATWAIAIASRRHGRPPGRDGLDMAGEGSLEAHGTGGELDEPVQMSASKSPLFLHFR
ncbi:MAG TPA: MFS transporter [Dyella sp.]|uniref:MFS transporter n=1 Tax=Dyella sp. TaxID=1869338 RepID=UPI002B518058|nr:MFS transporter [Dyella sp.]HUB91848.1 MFS transporter [Dyella sp.]